MRKKWFLFFLKRFISQRKGRVLIASLSVTLAVAIITGVAGITLGIKDKLGKELKAYGSNIIVTATQGDVLKEEHIRQILYIKDVEDVTGQLYGSAVMKGEAIEIIGLELNKLKARGWRISGYWPEKRGEVLAGVNIKDAFNLRSDLTISITADKKISEFIVKGFVERGGAEDNTIIMDIKDAQAFFESDEKLSAILVSGRSGKIEDIVDRIKGIIPGASVRTIRQVAHAEESLLRKIQLLMVLVTAVVLSATAISVASTMGANVLERREEIGLMKAIGGTKKEIGIFYIAEAAITGGMGGIAGFILGFISAQIVSKGAFGSYIEIPLYLSIFSFLIGACIAVSASYLPVRNAVRYNPAVILRGE